jgi:transcriptional regulator with XRE-family HTH domain
VDKQEHGLKLKAAMSLKGFDRQAVADATKVNARTVTNWTSGATMPSPRERDVLRRLLGPYDSDGDPVEQAIHRSELTAWRQAAVLSEYQRHLYEQRAQAV